VPAVEIGEVRSPGKPFTGGERGARDQQIWRGSQHVCFLGL